MNNLSTRPATPNVVAPTGDSRPMHSRLHADALPREQLEGRHLTNPIDGSEWEVKTLFKHQTRLRRVGQTPAYGTLCTVKNELLGHYVLHELPALLRRGDILVRHGQGYIVSGFEVLGNAMYIGITGCWSDVEADREEAHENLVPNAMFSLLHDGFRLPFDGETVFVSDRARTVAARTAAPAAAAV